MKIDKQSYECGIDRMINIMLCFFPNDDNLPVSLEGYKRLAIRDINLIEQIEELKEDEI